MAKGAYIGSKPSVQFRPPKAPQFSYTQTRNLTVPGHSQQGSDTDTQVSSRLRGSHYVIIAVVFLVAWLWLFREAGVMMLQFLIGITHFVLQSILDFV
jgi:hypothetical protein